ncbi:RNA polymerase II transcription factor SIII subunit A-domain-containing protein [Sphaerosporella brunnea]|uniref:RNA polymerase II transcription factor SIII subunit A-domain-containing protein n=1 Tax=Sphaerosporella brunnea TaxID=1250544 RepID=A0A5J5EPT4_9PEZI|nr:RNA polymerase II transcription factor SIII subunit A-domain-containing protein [Sphaerosporella brunnea]
MATMNGPQSLYSCAKSVLIKYINTLEDVGDLEYRILEPVLKKVTSPHQLKKIEANSPQIAADDEELWKKFIQRDFGATAVEKWVPKNPSGWSKVYDKHRKEESKRHELAAEALSKEYQGLQSSKETGRTRLVSASSLPPVRKKQPWGGSSSGWGQSANSWNHQAGIKTKNIIQKAKREAKEMSRFRSENSKLARPMLPNSSVPAAARLNESMKQKIRSQEEIRKERERNAEISRQNGKASGALGKRKSEDREVEDKATEQSEAEKRRKTEEWRRKAMEKRAPVVGGPRLKPVAERPKKANPLAMPPPRRR